MYVSDGNYEALKKRNETNHKPVPSPATLSSSSRGTLLYIFLPAEVYSYTTKFTIAMPSNVPAYTQIIYQSHPVPQLNMDFFTSSKAKKDGKKSSGNSFFFHFFLGFPNLDSLLSSFSIAQT